MSRSQRSLLRRGQTRRLASVDHLLATPVVDRLCRHPKIRGNSQHQKTVHEWNTLNEDVPRTRFTEQILPLLQDVPLSEMVQATGLSKGYCSFIKRGLKTPHERHWSALEQLGGRRT